MSPQDKESYMVMATMLAIVQGKALPHLEATRNLKALHYAHKAEEALLKMFGHLTWERTDEEVQMLHDYMRRGIFRIDLPPEGTEAASTDSEIESAGPSFRREVPNESDDLTG